MAGDKVNPDNIEALAQWFNDRNISTLEAVSIMGGLVADMIATCAPKPIKSADVFAEVLRNRVREHPYRRGA